MCDKIFEERMRKWWDYNDRLAEYNNKTRWAIMELQAGNIEKFNKTMNENEPPKFNESTKSEDQKEVIKKMELLISIINSPKGTANWYELVSDAQAKLKSLIAALR